MKAARRSIPVPEKASVASFLVCIVIGWFVGFGGIIVGLGLLVMAMQSIVDLLALVSVAVVAVIVIVAVASYIKWREWWRTIGGGIIGLVIGAICGLVWSPWWILGSVI